MTHKFPEDFIFEEPRNFTDPFRYVPHPAVLKAAELVMKEIDKDSALSKEFSYGKMLGVLVVKNKGSEGNSTAGYIAAFSGNVGGRSKIEGFVPPIFDLTDPAGEFKKGETEISSINRQIAHLKDSATLSKLKKELSDYERDRDIELAQMKTRLAESKLQRESIRKTCSDASGLETLIKESQFEKAEFRRLKSSWEDRISNLKTQMNEIMDEVDSLKRKRASMSEKLQDWIFRQYIVHDASGRASSIADIFADSGLIPPGGTGECAAPKLLEYAYREGLEPVAMGEFWYGESPETAVRTHGHFYPSCTSKCGPLLGYMLKGINTENLDTQDNSNKLSEPVIIFEDNDVIVVEKPSGMPSVPGLDGRKSLQDWMGNDIHAVHRLDMDTSGVMIFAKHAEAAVRLRKQFEEHSIKKTYIARICASDDGKINNFESGSIDLPLSADYDERPRQKVDAKNGKDAHTEYTIVKTYQDGISEVLLYPHTGRTHQLRVHCAHISGLGRPILGDPLYGSSSIYNSTATRLNLHALSITFCHPVTEESMTFTSQKLIY